MIFLDGRVLFLNVNLFKMFLKYVEILYFTQDKRLLLKYIV